MAAGQITRVDVMLELIKILPQLFWSILAGIIVAMFYRPIRDEVIPNLGSFEAGGVKLSFMRDSYDATIQLANKNPQWKVKSSVESKERAIDRARKNIRLFKGSKFLWVDDHPENNSNERHMFQQLGAVVDIAKATQEALDILDKTHYDLIISDMARGANVNDGLDFLGKLRAKKDETPVIFYLGEVDETKGTPVGAFGLTNRPDELLHLTIDVLARKKS